MASECTLCDAVKILSISFLSLPNGKRAISTHTPPYHPAFHTIMPQNLSLSLSLSISPRNPVEVYSYTRFMALHAQYNTVTCMPIVFGDVL